MIDLSQLEKVKTSSDIETENAKAAAKKYLSDTDFYIIRNLETARPVPDDVQEGRKNARAVLDKQ